MEQQKNNGEWVILEAMGHRTAAGRYYFENGLHRIDVPDVSPDAAPDSFVRTERYGGASIYCITSVDEATARTVAKRNAIPEAIPWDVRRELAKLAAPGEQVQLLPRDVDEDWEQEGREDDWDGSYDDE